MEFYQGFLEGFDMTFLEAGKKHYEDYLGWGIWYNHGTNFNMLQLSFPSTTGIWSCNVNASEAFKWFQPVLNAS